jgi:predicted PurR-regulated permease PerM
VIITVGITSLVFACLWCLWIAADLALLVFAAMLLAILIESVADQAHRWLSVPKPVAVGAVGVLLVALAVLVLWLSATQFSQQVSEFSAALTAAWKQVREKLEQSQWGAYLLDVPNRSALRSWRGNLIGGISGAFSTASGILVNIVFILVVAIYLALQPDRYRRGFLHLVPHSFRQRADETVSAVAYTLRWWLLSRLVNMTIVGILTAIGLGVLGIPLVVPLSLIAFVLDFVPYLGPIAAAVPAILVALTSDGGPTTALYVALLYLGIQTVESYFLQPFIEGKAVQMSPAMLVTAQVFLGLVFGTLGVIVATPLTAATLVAVKMLYVEDILEDRTVQVKAEDAVEEGRDAAAHNGV